MNSAVVQELNRQDRDRRNIGRRLLVIAPLFLGIAALCRWSSTLLWGVSGTRVILSFFIGYLVFEGIYFLLLSTLLRREMAILVAQDLMPQVQVPPLTHLLAERRAIVADPKEYSRTGVHETDVVSQAVSRATTLYDQLSRLDRRIIAGVGQASRLTKERSRIAMTLQALRLALLSIHAGKLSGRTCGSDLSPDARQVFELVEHAASREIA